jgi:NTE family protein
MMAAESLVPDPSDVSSPSSPVRAIPTDTQVAPAPGIALCLSGGGYRAMLFHLGALWRLNELVYLPKLARISSVSGGSITAGVLGHRWHKLAFVNDVATTFTQEVVAAIRALAGETIDVGNVLSGIFLPGSIADKVAASYNTVFEHATLQDLPDTPRFVINATNVQSAALWRFSKPYMWDWRVGKVANPTIELAVAVGASSAFPPVLSPARLHLKDGDFVPGTGVDLQKPPFTEEVFLTDGGVYDNLGLETAWKVYDTILVSDGGAKLAPDPEPHTDWVRHSLRINDVVDNQVRSLRKRQLIASYKSGQRKGTYWSVRSGITDYPAPHTLPCPTDQTMALAEQPTRLAEVSDVTQKRLINWGYAICDAAMRAHVVPAAPAPATFPYPDAKVGD